MKKEVTNPPFTPAEAHFLTVASMQCLKLIFTIVKNYDPLVREMQKFGDFQSFVEANQDTKLNQVINPNETKK